MFVPRCATENYRFSGQNLRTWHIGYWAKRRTKIGVLITLLNTCSTPIEAEPPDRDMHQNYIDVSDVATK